MPINRLSDIEENLELLREQVVGKQKALNLAPQEEKTRIKLQIRELRKEIREQEEEYWQVFARQVKTVEIAEEEAEIIVGEIVEDLGQIEVQGQSPDRVLQLLQEIRDAVNKPGSTAGLKLKGVISPIPPFVAISIEGELDGDQFVRQNFPTFQNWAKLLAKKS